MTIAGHPHLALADIKDPALKARMVSALKTMGFSVEGEQLIPPPGITGQNVIIAMTVAFQKAKEHS